MNEIYKVMVDLIYYRFIEIYMEVAPMKTLLHQIAIIIKTGLS